jgi:hypothetical protein
VRRWLSTVFGFLLLLPAFSARPETPAKDAKGPRFKFGVLLLAYEPTEDRETRDAGLFYGFVSASWAQKGWGARAEIRGTDGRFRPYFQGNIWLEHAYAYVSTKAGDIQVGQIAPAFAGEDATFSGDLLSVNGFTRNPEYGAALEGSTGFGYNTLAWRARYIGQNDHVAWEDDGRGVESDPGANLRDGFQASVSYLVNKGLVTFKPVLAGGTGRVVDSAGESVLRFNDLAGSFRASVGPIALSVTGTLRDGSEAAAMAKGTSGLPRLAYDRSVGGSASLVAEFPTVIYRYVYSAFEYRGTGYSENLQQPSVIWMPRKGVEATIEYSWRRLEGEGFSRTSSAFRFALGLTF